jgi:riboflavin synthase
MFTGIVEERGTVVRTDPQLTISARTVGEDSMPGASVSVNGVCLTVVDRSPDGGNGRCNLSFDLSPESLARTSLGSVQPGDPVNLERPVTLLTRLGGHLVQGHVDGVGEVVDIREAETGMTMLIRIPPELARYAVDKGSIAVDGVSLTIVQPTPGEFSVALIPHTLQATTLGAVKPGARVNLEVDLVAKYVEGMVKERA